MEIDIKDIEFGEPIEEREGTFFDGYRYGLYKAHNIIDSKQKEIERLNNIIQKAIKKLENEIKYLEHLDKIGAMYSTEQNRFNSSLLQELKGDGSNE